MSETPFNVLLPLLLLQDNDWLRKRYYFYFLFYSNKPVHKFNIMYGLPVLRKNAIDDDKLRNMMRHILT